jgi:peptidoglycan-associated lipoprotein
MRGSTAMTIVAMGLALAALAGLGCRKQAPVTAADSPAPGAVTATPSLDGSEQPARPDDPFAGDLDALNEYLRRERLLQAIYFDYDSAELSPEARQQLLANARFLAEHPELVVLAAGHADERGTNDYNLALGERRAGAVAGMLRTLGVAPERLRTTSYGEEQPACGESTESCWSRNRRAEFTVVGRRQVG